MLGFRCSDEFYAGEKSNIVGSFNRLDRGDGMSTITPSFAFVATRAASTTCPMKLPTSMM